MTHELNWLRSKARHLGTETMVITPSEASEAEREAGTYRIDRYGFSANERRVALNYRAAAALDRTHNPGLPLSSDPYAIKVRAYLAAYLDGKKTNALFVLQCCRYLEMVAT